MVASKVATGPPDVVPMGWEAVQSHRTSEFYYVNTTTGETTWDILTDDVIEMKEPEVEEAVQERHGAWSDDDDERSLAVVRLQYQNYSEEQLRRACREAWLDSTATPENMVELLVGTHVEL